MKLIKDPAQVKGLGQLEKDFRFRALSMLVKDLRCRALSKIVKDLRYRIVKLATQGF